MYYVQLTICSHKYMNDWISEYPSSLAYTLSLSVHYALLNGNKLSSKNWYIYRRLFFENHCINVVFMYIKKPIHDLWDTLSPAWSLSTNMQMSISLPQGSGVFMDIASLASL